MPTARVRAAPSVRPDELDWFREAEPFLKAIAAHTGGIVELTGEDPVCGSEGCVLFGDWTVGGRTYPVGLKLGRGVFTEYEGESDYDTAAQIVGVRIPGVAEVYGVWRRGSLYALLRERVDTDWGEFARRAGVSPDVLREGFRGARVVGARFALACASALSPRAAAAEAAPPHGALAADMHAARLDATLAGLAALAERGICAGRDMHFGNLGWRLDERGEPEAVLLDLGTSGSVPGAEWRERPRRINRGHRPAA